MQKNIKGNSTIQYGFGHYGPDVKSGQTITAEEAEELLRNDMGYYEDRVNSICSYLSLNENEFSALVSFCYNTGEKNLMKLTGNQTRSKEEILEHIIYYTSSGNSANKKGLTNRRKDEIRLFKGEY